MSSRIGSLAEGADWAGLVAGSPTSTSAQASLDGSGRDTLLAARYSAPLATLAAALAGATSSPNAVHSAPRQSFDLRSGP